ncbi:PHD finger protein 13-like [Lytechinus pictus]|uniref:PHD finger protein 13-like n=1 Tax=Lytechinus pictus TaxID=7653 RepID=UPI00240CECDE|nr:PHD finger protein 13-like [Lytechinus pictus]
MSTDLLSAPIASRGMKKPKAEKEDLVAKQPVLTDFSTFCTWVLDYEASLHNGDIPYVPKTPERVKKRSISPLDSEGNSVGSGADSDISPRERYSKKGKMSNIRERDEDWNLITCFCNKPFAGRPMIECNECMTWVHLSCAKIRKTNVPDIFICTQCRDTRSSIRKSNRQREPKKQFSELYGPGES